MDYSKFNHLLSRNPGAEKLSINHRRLNYGEGGVGDVAAKRELITLNFLLATKSGIGAKEALEDTILKGVLFVNNSINAPKESKDLVLELERNQKLVKAVLRSVFQWLGTSVGINAVNELHNLLEDYASERTKASNKKFELTMEVNELERKKTELKKQIEKLTEQQQGILTQ